MARQRAELGALPIGIDKQGVGAGKCCKPPVEASHEILARSAGTERLMGDRLDDSESVLDPVGQLAKEDMLPPLPLLALGDVASGLKRETAARDGPYLDAGFDRHLATIL